MNKWEEMDREEKDCVIYMSDVLGWKIPDIVNTEIFRFFVLDFI